MQFEWIPKCEHTFALLEKILFPPQSFIQADSQGNFVFYLDVSVEVVSAFLIRKVDNTQKRYIINDKYTLNV